MGLKNVLGFWKATAEDGEPKLDKNGNPYMSGKCREEIVIPAGTRVLMYKNARKEKDSHPDWNMLMPDDGEDQRPSRPQRNNEEPF